MYRVSIQRAKLLSIIMDASWIFLVVVLCFTGAVNCSGKCHINLKTKGCIGIVSKLKLCVPISGASNRGRLLSPEEGCGIQPVDKTFLMQYHSDWPWMGSLLTPSDTKPLVSECSKLFNFLCFADQPFNLASNCNFFLLLQ